MTTTTMTKARAKAPAAETMKHPPYTDQEWEKLEATDEKLMAKMNRLCNKAKADTQEDGIRFAVAVLKIMEEEYGADRTSAFKEYIDTIDDKRYYYRRGPQSRLLWRALERFVNMNRPAQVGVAIVFTDYLGSVCGGAVPDLDATYCGRDKPEHWQLNEHGQPV